MNRTGDGHKMGVWAGGEIELTTHTKMIHDARVGRVDTPHLLVNAKGERFMCEGPMQGYLNNYVREYIHEAGGDAKAASAASVALEARRRIDAMFKVDSKFDDMEPGGRKAARDAELRPLMEDFGGWARAQLPLASPKLAPHRALQYAVEFCLCSISCCGFSHDDFSGLGRACRPRNGLNWMVLVSPPERTGKDYDQHAPSTVYPSFAAERGIRRVDRAENTCQRADGA